MRVLWFEVTPPKNYSEHSFHGAGWQDSLEYIIKQNSDIELGIAFDSKDINDQPKIIDNVHYYPLKAKYSPIEKIKDRFSYEVSRNKLIPLSLKVIEDFKPDIIHVFGSEWCYGQVAKFTDIPVIVHIQGSIPPYNNAFYPPGYNKVTEFIFNLTHLKLKNLINLPITWHKRKTWKEQEERTLSIVHNYMGRTHWDKGLIELYQPGANYFYCSEALRPQFIEHKKKWKPTSNKILRLTTTGCSSFWKGLDTIIRTAKLLKEKNIKFEWCLVGKIGHKEFLEWKEKTKMEEVNIRLMGILNADHLLELLIQTDLYIHTAYIDNSPNAVCEAQYLGLPIIASYVGGIPSLIENNVDGMLIPANDPYSFANEIIKLSKDKPRQILYSEKAQEKAFKRHNPGTILNDLLKTYQTIATKK